jgi:hypothetical protein
VSLTSLTVCCLIVGYLRKLIRVTMLKNMSNKRQGHYVKVKVTQSIPIM